MDIFLVQSSQGFDLAPFLHVRLCLWHQVARSPDYSPVSRLCLVALVSSLAYFQEGVSNSDLRLFVKRM
jgi:hypothetical protein